MGDLPVPPVERFPTQIIGRPKPVDRKIFLSYSQFRIAIANQYNKAKGSKRMRKDLRKKLENMSSGKNQRAKVRKWQVVSG
jgi:hypothetical protein